MSGNGVSRYNVIQSIPMNTEVKSIIDSLLN